MKRLNQDNTSPKYMSQRIQNLIAGFKKIAATEQFDVLGTMGSPPTLLAELLGLLAPFSAADDADTAADKARRARNAAQPHTLDRIDAIEEAVRSHYGSRSSDLKQFGLQPHKKPKKPTAAQSASRAAKSKATRDARKAALEATKTPRK